MRTMDFKERFTKEQIFPVQKEGEVGIPAKELYRQHRISEATFYTWTDDGAEFTSKTLKLITVPKWC